LFDNANGNTSFFFNNNSDSETNTSSVYYRHTNNTSLLARASTEIRRVFTNARGFKPTSLFIATWDIVEQDLQLDMVRNFKDFL